MGYAKIDRKVLDSEIFNDDKLLSFYVRLILLARIKPCYDNDVLIGKGQLFTSVRRLSGVLNSNYSNTYRLLSTLEEKHLISIKKYHEGSLITVFENFPQDNNPNNLKQQKECFAKRKRNTDETPTLLYNKKENMVKQGVPDARLPKKEIEKNNGSSDREDIKNSELRDLQIPTRESLVEKYGEANVFEYECRFERWRSRQRKYVAITCYEAIERWMRDDHVQKPQKQSTSEAAYDTDEIMQRIINSYNN